MAISKIFIFFILVFVGIFFTSFFIFLNNDSEFICGDSTLNGTCSEIKPFFCKDGILIGSLEKCGCFENFSLVDGKCFSQLQTGSRKIKLDYFLNGERKFLEYEVYTGVVDYLSKLKNEIDLRGINYTREIFERSRMEESIQRQFILPIVVEISNLGKTKKERVEIAVSLVQAISYEDSKKEINFNGIKIPYTRYPYEVLYEQKGICGEKSQLLYLILDALGEDVVLFYFPEENHEGVGIRCRFGSFKKTGYCYIETTNLFEIGIDPSEVLITNTEFKNFEMIKV